MDGRRFDDRLGIAVLVAAGVLLAACVLGADWIRPPAEGPGPLVSAGRRRALYVTVAVAAVVCGVCLARAFWGTTVLPLVTATGAALVSGFFAYVLYLPRAVVEVRADGFATADVVAPERGTAMFSNTTGADVVVCLGSAGDCADSAGGPAELRSPGLIVPAGHRVAVTMPAGRGDYRVTLAGTEHKGRHDMTLHVRRDPVL